MTWESGTIVIEGERRVPWWWCVPPGQRMRWSIIQHGEDDFRISLGQVDPNFESKGWYMGRGSTGGRDIWRSPSLDEAKAHVARQVRLDGNC